MEDFDELYKELLEKMMDSRRLGKPVITGSQKASTNNYVSGSPSFNIPSFDFASLYPSTISMSFGVTKNITRKNKIRNIFPDIE